MATRPPPLPNFKNDQSGRSPYDQSVAIRPQNAMPVRPKPRKPCDANLVIPAMSKKFVTPAVVAQVGEPSLRTQGNPRAKAFPLALLPLRQGGSLARHRKSHLHFPDARQRLATARPGAFRPSPRIFPRCSFPLRRA